MEYILATALLVFIFFLLKPPTDISSSRYVYREDGKVKDVTDPDYVEEQWELDNK